MCQPQRPIRMDSIIRLKPSLMIHDLAIVPPRPVRLDSIKKSKPRPTSLPLQRQLQVDWFSKPVRMQSIMRSKLTLSANRLVIVPPRPVRLDLLWEANYVLRCSHSAHLDWNLLRGKSILSWCDGSSDRSFMVDPLSYFLLQPVFHNWFNKGHGMYYPICGMMHIK